MMFVIFALSLLDVALRGFKRENLIIPLIIAAAVLLDGALTHNEIIAGKSDIEAAHQAIVAEQIKSSAANEEHRKAVLALQVQSANAISDVQTRLAALNAELASARSNLEVLSENERTMSAQERQTFLAYREKIRDLDSQIAGDQQQIAELQSGVRNLNDTAYRYAQRISQLEPRFLNDKVRSGLVNILRGSHAQVEIHSEPGVPDAGILTKELSLAIVEAGSPQPTWDPAFQSTQNLNRIIVQGPDPYVSRQIAETLMEVDADSKYVNASVGDHYAIYLSNTAIHT